MDYLLLVIPVWLLSAVFAALMAGGKNRNVGGWLLTGFVLGVFAIIILAFLPRLPSPLEL